MLDKPATGEIRVGLDAYSLAGGATISRADLAHILVRQSDSRDWIGHAVAVTG